MQQKVQTQQLRRTKISDDQIDSVLAEIWQEERDALMVYHEIMKEADARMSQASAIYSKQTLALENRRKELYALSHNL